jgi:hypothetical protein
MIGCLNARKLALPTARRQQETADFSEGFGCNVAETQEVACMRLAKDC